MSRNTCGHGVDRSHTVVENVAHGVGDGNIEGVELEGDIPFFGVLYGTEGDQHPRERILQSQRQ
jgi:hypothetical protein